MNEREKFYAKVSNTDRTVRMKGLKPVWCPDCGRVLTIVTEGSYCLGCHWAVPPELCKYTHLKENTP